MYKTLDENDCPDYTRVLLDKLDKLKSLTNIKPKVIQDFMAIHDKFPCQKLSFDFLNRFVSSFDFIKI